MVTDSEWYRMEEKVHELARRVRALEAEVRELRALATPLDPGPMANEGEGTDGT